LIKKRSGALSAAEQRAEPRECTDDLKRKRGEGNKTDNEGRKEVEEKEGGREGRRGEVVGLVEERRGERASLSRQGQKKRKTEK